MTFSVFGTRPVDAIYLPDLPYAARLNCKDGGLFVGGSAAEYRRTTPKDSFDISILKVSRWFGSLGKTKNVLWLQLFFVAAPDVTAKILPPNTVCVSYIKKQSIGSLMNTVQEALEHGDPGHGIFKVSFIKEASAAGPYYSLGFEWRARQSDVEKKQLDMIDAFMQVHGNNLLDLEGTRELIPVSGKSAAEIQALVEAAKRESQLLPASDVKQLAAAA